MVGKEFASLSPPPPAWPRYGSSELPDSGVGFAPGRGGEKPRLHNSLVTRHPVLPFPITHPPLMETGRQVERTEEGNVAQKEEGTLAVESSRICLARAGDGEKKEAAQHVRGLSCQMWPLPGVCLPLHLHT